MGPYSAVVAIIHSQKCFNEVYTIHINALTANLPNLQCYIVCSVTIVYSSDDQDIGNVSKVSSEYCMEH